MTTIALAPPPTRTALAQQFNDLALDFTRNDEHLEAMDRDRNSVGSGWDTWFVNASTKLQDARDGYRAAMPQDEDMSARLSSDVVSLAESGGRMAIMQSHGSTLGTGWSSTLDGKIADVRDAAMRLVATPPAPTPPAPGGDVPPAGPPAAAGMVTAAVADVRRAAELVAASLRTIGALPHSDHGSDSTKAGRIGAFQQNSEAQRLLEQHFSGESPTVTSQLRTADASLEDAAWQLAKKPSPDGRFAGVDIPGAERDTRAALEILQGLGGR